MQKVSFDAPIQSGFSEAQPGQASAWDDHDDKVGLKYKPAESVEILPVPGKVVSLILAT